MGSQEPKNHGVRYSGSSCSRLEIRGSENQGVRYSGFSYAENQKNQKTMGSGIVVLLVAFLFI